MFGRVLCAAGTQKIADLQAQNSSGLVDHQFFRVSPQPARNQGL